MPDVAVAYDRAVGSSLIVRPARVHDVRQMARVHVRCWAGDVSRAHADAVLDDPGFPAARERMCTGALTGGRYRQNRVAVAERDDELAGIAMSGPPEDATAAWTRQLYVLYVYAAGHGTGAGRALLEAVIDSAEPAALWVADPTLARRRSTASTASLPTGQPGPGTGCGRSAWCAACSTTGPAAPTGDCRRRNGLMACMALPWAPVGTLISSLPLGGSGPGQRLQNRCSARPGCGIMDARARAAPDKPDGRCAGSRIVR
jgi:L-amino acid N-acyltransferase YncA